MGDRAIVVFKREQEYSCGVYLHWDGHNVQEWLIDAAHKELFGKGRLDYACARFCGYAHERIKPPLSLGIFPSPTDKEIREKFKGYSPGDAGVFVVDIDTGQVENFDGYQDQRPFSIGPIPET